MSETPPPLPGFVTWPTFPFEGDLRVRALDDPVPVEPARHGEDPAECRACHTPDEAYIWVSERWRVRSLDRPTGLPMVLILESRSHLDLGDLPNMLAAELGVMTVRLERAVRSLDGVARVHVNRWGDGSAHLHLWFLARPAGRLQLRGTFLSLWDEILPPIAEYQWRENLALVAAWLADFGGRAIAEPPSIAWQAPATLTATSFGTVDQPDGRSDGAVADSAEELATTSDVPSDGGADPSTTTAVDGMLVPAPGTDHSVVGAERPSDGDGDGRDGDSAAADDRRRDRTDERADDNVAVDGDRDTDREAHGPGGRAGGSAGTADIRVTVTAVLPRVPADDKALAGSSGAADGAAGDAPTANTAADQDGARGTTPVGRDRTEPTATPV